MENFIQIESKDLFLLNKELLGLDEAQLWIGPSPDGPIDNDDARVLKERAEQEQKESLPGIRISGIEAVNLTISNNNPNWFQVDTSFWQVGIYRFNIHGKAGIQAPNGTKLLSIRDGQYSWPNFSDDFLLNLSDKQKQFLYLENNKAGFCMRIEIKEDRMIYSAGNGLEWIEKWPLLKKETELHYKEKIDSAKNL